MMYDGFNAVTILGYEAFHNRNDGKWDVYDLATCEILYTCLSKVRAIQKLLSLAYDIETFEVYTNGDVLPVE